MNYETFKTSTVTSLQRYFGETVTVSLQPIRKNNNVCLDGLTIQDSTVNITPTLYLNYYYEDYRDGKAFSSVLDDIIASYHDNLPAEDMDLSFFTDYDKVKYHLIYKLISYEKNAPLLADVPHFRFLDLAVVFCCYLSDTPNGNASILIQNHHLKFWGVTADQLSELALKNTPILLPYEIRSMEDALKCLCPDFSFPHKNKSETSDAPSMYVLSNMQKLYGASTILYPDVISGFADSIGCDLYILPSSIHEVLLLPKDPLSHSSDLSCIVKEVNASHVLKEEILSDHVYVYERAAGLIKI